MIEKKINLTFFKIKSSWSFFQLLPPWLTQIRQPTWHRVSWTSQTASTRATRASRNSRTSTASQGSSTAANTAESCSRTAHSISFTTGFTPMMPIHLSVLYVGCHVATGSSSTAILSVTSSKWGKKPLFFKRFVVKWVQLCVKTWVLFFKLNDSEFCTNENKHLSKFFFSYYFFEVPVFESYKCCWRFFFFFKLHAPIDCGT